MIRLDLFAFLFPNYFTYNGLVGSRKPPGGGGEYSHTLPIRVYGVVILKPPILNGVSISEAFSRTGYNEGGVRVCGDAVLRYIWCGFAVISILTRGIAVSKH